MLLSLYNSDIDETPKRGRNREMAPGSLSAITNPNSSKGKVIKIGYDNESDADLHDMMNDILNESSDDESKSSLQAAAQMAHISMPKKVSKKTNKKKKISKKPISNSDADTTDSTVESSNKSTVESPKKSTVESPKKTIETPKKKSVEESKVLFDDDLSDEVQDIVDRFDKKRKYSVADILMVSKRKNLSLERLKTQQKDIAPLIEQLQMAMLKSTMSFKNFPLFENIEVKSTNKDSRKIIESINYIITPSADKARLKAAELTLEIKKFMENVRQTYADYIALYKLFNHIYKNLSDKDKPVADQMLKRDTGAYHDIPCDPSKPVDWDQFNQDFMNAAVHGFDTTY